MVREPCRWRAVRRPPAEAVLRPPVCTTFKILLYFNQDHHKPPYRRLRHAGVCQLPVLVAFGVRVCLDHVGLGGAGVS